MYKLSTILCFLLVFVLLIFTSVFSAQINWPIKGEIDLSSGFGDYRQNRFHAGVDIRTGGKEGLQLFSPVNGYLYRIKMSYDGYGKGLYIKGIDDNIYVFGHLSDFSDKIDSMVKKSQILAKRYYLDLNIPQDSIKIEKDELIGYTGKTGSGEPHLHFEKRTDNNIPLNPLLNGFTISDTIKPVFTDIIYKLTDDHSLFPNGSRQVIQPVQATAKDGEYKTPELLYLNRPFGLLPNVFDKIRHGGMNQSVYKLSLYYDDKPYYQVIFNDVDFETQRSVNFVYDYPRAVDKQKNYRRLFQMEGNQYKGSKEFNKTKGIFGLKGEKIGLHKGKIVAEDCYGNETTLTFDFIWGPYDNIYQLDSLTKIDSTATFYFTPTKDYKQLGVDSVQLVQNRRSRWGKITNYDMNYLDNGKLILSKTVDQVKPLVFSLLIYAGDLILREKPFNGIQEKGKPTTSLNYEIVDDGIIFTINIISPFASDARLELYYQDSLLGIEYPEFFNMDEYKLFLPPKKQYTHIDKIGYSMSKDTTTQSLYMDTINIYAVGYEDEQVIDAGNNFTLNFNRDNFFSPRYIDVKSNILRNRNKMKLSSDHLQILPEAFVCKSDFEISVKLKEVNRSIDKSGLCWLDEQKNKWVWLENEMDGSTLKAKSTGGGSFASVYDRSAPKVSMMSIAKGKSYYNRMIPITFVIEDTLSGIYDDQSIKMTLDNEWIIPEYEPKSGEFKTKPNKPLSIGKHRLEILIFDQVGNKYQKVIEFTIKELPTNHRKKP
ncbi:M23 family metallopeptidase [Candidatus Zixiibacteriota bacterium]